MDSIQPGTVFGNSYELIDLLGRGGMGEVWRAKHLRLPKEVAIKVLHRLPENNPDIAARFKREAEIASRLNHAHIADVTDYNVHDNGVPYIVMELLLGQSLADALAVSPMDLERVQQIARQITKALVEAHHQQVIHRDLKPENIFLTPLTRGNEHVTVLDFGTSKILDSTSVQTQAAAIIGTPMYMAPEQAAAENDRVGTHTDQFALALVIYEMLSGKAAFGGGMPVSVIYRIVHEEPTPIAELVPKLPSRIVSAIEKALSKKPESRFESVAAFCQEFCGDDDLILPACVETSNELAALGTANTVDYVETDRLPYRSGKPIIALFFLFFLASAAVIFVLGNKAGSWFAPIVADSPPELRLPESSPGNNNLTQVETEMPALPPLEARREESPQTARFSERRALDDPIEAIKTPKVTPKTVRQAKKKTPPPAPPKEGVAEDIRNAQSALNRGDSKKALHLARRALRNGGASNAASVIVMVHCSAGNLSAANGIFSRVKGRNRGKVKRFCQKKNVVLH